ncbi:copper amine oxidase N-terminal domain-containing protein, partial [Anaerotignum sp.]
TVMAANEPTMITNVEITGVTEPAVGAMPTFEGMIIPEECSLDFSAWMSYADVVDGMPSEAKVQKDAFTEGKNYGFQIKLMPKDGYTFGGTGEAPTVTVNGKPGLATYSSDGGRWVYFLCGELSAPVEEITTLAATVIPPVGGENPSNTATVTDDRYKVDSVYWLDGNITMTDSNTFVAGKTYTAEVWFSPIGNNTFADGVTAKINDVNANKVNTVKEDGRQAIAFTRDFVAEAPVVPTVEVTLPVTKIVEQKGNVAPGTETFQFQLVTTPNALQQVLLTDNSIKTDGSDREITLSIPETALRNGVSVQLKEVNDGKANWTYDDTVYTVKVVPRAGETTVVYDTEFWVGNDKADALTFTNSYDYTKSTSKGGGGGSTKYKVILEDTDNGDVESSRTKASKGTTVYITTDPDAGYGVDDIKVTKKNGEEVEVTDKGDGRYAFKMPAANVYVDVTFEKTADSTGDGEEAYIRLTIDSVIAWVFDEYVTNDVPPVIRNERTMLPARFVAEALGGVVTWNEAEQKVTIEKDGSEIMIFIGEPFATVDGDPVELDCAAYIENDRTYLPIRFIAENLGAEVVWDAVARTVTITP